MEPSIAIIPAPTHRPDLERIKALALDAVASPNSRRAYGDALDKFLAWYATTSPGPLSKAAVNSYRATLESQGLAPSSINVALSAIRKLAVEAGDNGLLDPAIAAGIARVKGVAKRGTKTGNWLTREQAESLINAPNTGTLKGTRDRAILCLLIGCGLRRGELSSLTVEKIQMREGRWIIVDLLGKGHRVRSVPMPSWTWTAIQAWLQASGISEGPVFLSMRRWDKFGGNDLDEEVIRQLVQEYARKLGLGNINPHDLRRTFAKLAHKGHAALEQIQLSLGHASIVTTELYLGVQQNLTDAPCDHLGLKL